MAVHTFKPRTQETEASGSLLSLNKPRLHSEFQDSQGYVERPCLKKGKERKGKERKGKERKGKERKGKERKGKERKGKEKEKRREEKRREEKRREEKRREEKRREGKSPSMSDCRQYSHQLSDSCAVMRTSGASPSCTALPCQSPSAY
jgi:hypothetical protein